MKLQELYDHITRQITPEEALKRFLESSLIKYEHLKFDDKQNPVHPLIILAMASMDMGWGFIVERGEDNDEVRGVITGTNDYINHWFNKPKSDSENQSPDKT